MKRRIIFLLACTCMLMPRAQVLNNCFKEDTSLDSLTPRSLRINVDAIGFFHDNEYNSQIQNGYSLPGVRLTPIVAYNPLSNINIEVGATMLVFNGASKYPNFAYHDISTWKGEQYQSGAHVLPWIRLQASLKHLDVILGNIYGATNHDCITPLYNPEQNLSTDPEMGVQLLLHRPHIKLDTWLNWQSYIFKTETHQEAFTVGTTAKILWGKQQSELQNSTTVHTKRLSVYTPVQLLIQHRGGEQDNTNFGVQTLCNASAGVGVCWTPNLSENMLDSTDKTHNNSPLDYLDAQANAIGSYQQAGELWPFDTGFSWHLGVKTKWFNHLYIDADYQHSPKQFASLYGNPFFSTFSIQNGGTMVKEDGSLRGHYEHQYKGMQHIRLGIGYDYTFAKSYTIGAAAELFSLHSTEAKHTDTTNTSKGLHEFNFSFGIYLRVSPSFLIKKF